MYLEGSDQHRGWFHSSLLESCGTRGRAPFDVVLTHGFILDEKGRKMSKSLGNVTAPQDVIKQSGADILRMWVCASDYADDLRIGPEILKTTVDTYRKLRNTMRWMLGTLAHFQRGRPRRAGEMPELERLMLHRLAELDALVRQAYADFDYKRIFAALIHFMTIDLSAFYFDIRKDALYCDPISSATRKACADRARPPVPLHRDLARADAVLHRRGGLAARATARRTPRCISSCSPRCRRRGATTRSPRSGARCAWCAASSPARSRSSAPASASAPRSRPLRSCYVSNPDLFAALVDVDLAEICITSAATLVEGEGPGRRVPAARRARRRRRAASSPRARKCARSWKISPRGRHRSAISRRHAARRAGAARVGRHAQGGGMSGSMASVRRARATSGAR